MESMDVATERARYLSALTQAFQPFMRACSQNGPQAIRLEWTFVPIAVDMIESNFFDVAEVRGIVTAALRQLPEALRSFYNEGRFSYLIEEELASRLYDAKKEAEVVPSALDSIRRAMQKGIDHGN